MFDPVRDLKKFNEDEEDAPIIYGDKEDQRNKYAFRWYVRSEQRNSFESFMRFCDHIGAHRAKFVTDSSGEEKEYDSDADLPFNVAKRMSKIGGKITARMEASNGDYTLEWLKERAGMERIEFSFSVVDDEVDKYIEGLKELYWETTDFADDSEDWEDVLSGEEIEEIEEFIED